MENHSKRLKLLGWLVLPEMWKAECETEVLSS